MRVTIVPVKGHKNVTFQMVEQSWEPDESAAHDQHTELNPSCARCVTASGDFKVKSDEPTEES